MNARGLLAVGVGAAVLLTGVVATVDSPQAHAATAGLVKGPGVAVTLGGNTSWLGAYRDKKTGALVWCEDILLQAGDGTFKAGPHPVRYDTETRARLATLVNLYGPGVTTNTAALRVKLAQDTLIAPWDATLRKWMPTLLAKASAADKAAVNAMVARSAIHAPYTAKTVVEGAVPGQRGKATITVLGSNGRPADGIKVTWSLSGGRAVETTTTTNSLGQASDLFDGTGLGQAVTATATAPSATKVWSNVPTTGHQTMIGGGFTDTIKASDAAELCPVTAELRKTCPCKDGTTRTYTYTVHTLDTPGAYVAWVQVDGLTVQTVNLGAGSDATLTAQVRAGSTVTVRYSIVDKAGRALWTDVLDETVQR